MLKGYNFRDKKVLITGGLGFIGSNLAHRCLELGAKVSLYDNLDPNSGGNLYNIKDIKAELELHLCDILDFEALADQVNSQDFIFNCAAATSHIFSLQEPCFSLEVNSRGVINLMEAVRRFNPEAKVIHIGTSTQLGRLIYQPADEKHPEFPTDIYSANKTAAEKYALIYAWTYNLDITTIRLPNVFGPRAGIHSPALTFNNYFIGLALQNKDISVYGEGKQLRNVLYVDDAVEALIAAAQSDKVKGETFFAVADNHWSVAQIAEATVKYIGSGRVQYVPWPPQQKAIDIGDAVLSNAKIKQVLNWAPAWELTEGLLKTREYYLPCLKHYLR
jgi:UDP-glucose 4-epimerase